MECPNVDSLIAVLVANKYASLHELKTVYTLEDAYDLFEILAVTRYNEFLAVEHANEQRRK